MIGNQAAIQMLTSYIQAFFSGERKGVPFVIASGPANIGKSTIIQGIIKQQLGQFATSDFLHIRDLTEVLGKPHNLKIELPTAKEKQIIKISDNEQYLDIGIREINTWLQQSWFGSQKIVLLENIERMNWASANAFLKTCEEPLPGRLIIATTSHPSQLLDTIISRALVIKFHELTAEELLEFAKEQNIFVDDPQLQTFACAMAIGRPGALLHLHETLQANEEMKSDFKNLITLISEGKKKYDTYKILQNLNENGTLDTFLDGWIAYCSNGGMVGQSAKRLQVKKMMQSNVNTEHLLLYGLL